MYLGINMRKVRFLVAIVGVAVALLILSSYSGTAQVASADVKCKAAAAIGESTDNPTARSGGCNQRQPCLIGFNCCEDPSAPPGHCGNGGTGWCCEDGTCCKAGHGCGG